MKKIFAIALALVMVLSMASAFASPCTGGFAWNKDAAATACGQGKVEVVPFVKVNNACGGYDWEISSCAGAVASENIYWAIKLTVDANPDKEWWEVAELTVEAKKTNYAAAEWTFDVKDDEFDIDFEEDETVVYYALKDGSGWIDVEDDDLELKDVVFSARVNAKAKASDVEVCAKLVSDGEDFVEGIVGDYYVVYAEGEDAVEAAAATKATMTYTFANVTGAEAKDYDYRKSWEIISVTEKGNKTTVVVEAKNAGKLDDAIMAELAEEEVEGVLPKVKNGKDEVKAFAGEVNALYVWDDDQENLLVAYFIEDGKVRDIETYDVCGAATYEDIEDYFGIKINTKVDQELVNKNFAWDFEQEHCLPWSAAASAIVDAECVVAIPKTGDASVLAWLF